MEKKSKKTEILTLLRENEDYLSGQEICNRFGVSRTAVWKIINQLKEEGYQVEAVQNKGYKLIGQPDILSKSEIASRLHTKWVAHQLYYLSATTSTNIDAKRYLEEGDPHGTLVVAEVQTQGRGRRGKMWQSPAGQAIYMTIALKPDFLPEKASMLTLVMALSVGQAIQKLTGLEASIKWPNDVVVNKKKVCGILTEMNVEHDYIHSVVIGTGINANQKTFPKELRETATSLLLESSEIKRAALIAEVMDFFEKNYESFVKTEDMSGILKNYNDMLINRGKEVKILDPKGEFTAVAEGINQKGELVVRTEDGKQLDIYAGEVSVRGLYGYV